MSNLIEHAKRELAAAGLNKTDSDYDGMINNSVLELVQVFSQQGHSGASAPIVIDVFSKLAGFQPLAPLTGEDDEWGKIRDDLTGGGPLWQNKRCSHVFKDENGAYDIQGKIFTDDKGNGWLTSESKIAITFPYSPKKEYVSMNEEK